MKIGKLPENVWKRSVRKEIKNNIFDKGGIGVAYDSALLNYGGTMCVSEACLVPFCRQMGTLAVYMAVNAAAASGASPRSVMVSCMFDGRTDEDFLKHVAKSVSDAAGKLKCDVVGFDVHMIQGLKKPFITCSALGEGCSDRSIAKSDEDVVMAGMIGLGGSIMITDLKEKELKEYYPSEYIDGIYGFDKFLSVGDICEIAKKYNPSYMRSVAEGGILRTLWEMAEISKIGLEINLKDILIKQETVEICNYFDLNPYKLMSGGCVVFTTESGADAVSELESKGIRATIIGRTTSGNDKLILNDDEKTFITQADQDEIYSI